MKQRGRKLAGFGHRDGRIVAVGGDDQGRSG
jgi:hypothetical protein